PRVSSAIVVARRDDAVLSERTPARPLPAAPRLGGQPELGSDRLQRLDDRADVLVEVDAELLGALVDVLPVDARGERGLLQLLAHRLRLEPFEAGRADERARVDEAGELV